MHLRSERGLSESTSIIFKTHDEHRMATQCIPPTWHTGALCAGKENKGLREVGAHSISRTTLRWDTIESREHTLAFGHEKTSDSFRRRLQLPHTSRLD